MLRLTTLYSTFHTHVKYDFPTTVHMVHGILLNRRLANKKDLTDYLQRNGTTWADGTLSMYTGETDISDLGR